HSRVVYRCCPSESATPGIYALSLHDALPILRRLPQIPHPRALRRLRDLDRVASLQHDRGDLVGHRHHLVKTGSSLVAAGALVARSEEHTSELQSRENLVCRLLPEKKKQL